MGLPDLETVLRGKYPAKDHAARVSDVIRSKTSAQSGVLYLEGRMTKLQEDNDSPEPFRQRRFFYYLSGCNLADSCLAYDMQSSKLTLFIPPIDPDEVMWSGLPVSCEEALSMYDVDEVKSTHDINATLAHLASLNSGCTVYAIAGQVSDKITFLEFAATNFEALKEAISISRVIKDDYEVALIRKANQISGKAHEAVMARAKSARNERELEAAFLEKCMSNGAHELAYQSIIAAGKAAATLHYVHNNAPLEGKLNVLVDAGGEWNNYSSDITRTFPLAGRFTHESKAIYDIVYQMQQSSMAMIKAGVQWEDVHIHAHEVAIKGLLSLGILKGDAEEILTARTSTAFFPHGLGHYLGLDTHDTGGNPDRQDKDPMFRYLRLRGRLPAGSVVTVEPGVYFCEFIINPFLEDPSHKKFINSDVLDRYWDVGGVRIEDNLLVTESGYENLTEVAKEASAVEAAVAAN